MKPRIKKPGIKRWRLIVASATAAVLAAVAISILTAEYPTEQSARRTFTIDVSFPQVRKILVRTDAARRITTEAPEVRLSSSSGTINRWGLDSFDLKNPQWRIESHGRMKVRTNDDYIGQQLITLDQDVVISPASLRSEVQLEQGSGRLIGYALVTQFAQREGKPKSTCRLRKRS